MENFELLLLWSGQSYRQDGHNGQTVQHFISTHVYLLLFYTFHD